MLCLVAEDLESKQIAERLGVSIKSVQRHRELGMKRINAHSAVGVTRFMLRNGYVPL